jgi:hypothetical protein
LGSGIKSNRELEVAIDYEVFGRIRHFGGDTIGATHATDTVHPFHRAKLVAQSAIESVSQRFIVGKENTVEHR